MDGKWPVGLVVVTKDNILIYRLSFDMGDGTLGPFAIKDTVM